MNELVFFKRIQINHTLATLVTSVWFIPRVDPHVLLEGVRLCESRPALTALKRTLASVHPHVHFESRRGRERQSTLDTLIWLLPAVNAHVHFESGAGRKYFSALAALVSI